LYRAKYRISSQYGVSQYSDIKYFFTKRKNRSEKYINLYVKGTGRNNHDNAIVKINDTTVLENGNFQGLALVIISRYNFSVKEIQYYDTYVKQEPTVSSFQKVTYSYRQDGSLKNEVETVEKKVSNRYTNAIALYNKLLTLTEDKLFVLVSCYGWERYFTQELTDLLARYGALNILELKSFLRTDDLDTSINNRSVLNKHFYYHPYALIGIPNIGPGNGYESLRTNKGHYLSTDNLPSAELLVKFKFNKYARNYYFHTKQPHPRYSYKDDYDYLFKAEDYSLSNVIDLLLYKNTTTSNNYGFSIYDKAIDKETIFPHITGVYETELDRVVFGQGIGAKRYTVKGDLLQEGKVIKDEVYYTYYNNNVYNKKECNINKPDDSCPTVDMLLLSNPILQCKIGLTPNVCLTNKRYEFLFPGYN
jgi:hypothetical protein